MSILSVSFLLFCIALAVLYFLVPKKLQWPLLLVFSLAFYCLAGLSALPFLVLTALTAWGAARLIQADAEKDKAWLAANKAELSKQERDARKTKGKRRRRRILVLTLVLNFGILCAFKYVHFLLAQADAVARLFGGGVTDAIRWIVPLGISFYTFQTMGYLLDVYWNRCPAEKNPAKVLLFTSFFPQITQGPISTWSDLSQELFTPHSLDYRAFSYGAQRLIWGFFKKMVVANILATYVSATYADFESYTGAAVFLGMLCYSVQIYADFSGYMDIMCGLCQILGIRLTENFERPYFSKSIAEYWQRWHISLGRWFKNYLYYPVSLARWNQRLGKRVRKRFGRTAGAFVPVTLALAVVWLTTGLWHGASWSYVVWGAINGAVIIFSTWMEQTYARCRKALHLRDSAWLWRAFRVLRTFLLITFIKVLPEVGTLKEGFALWGRVFTGGFASSLEELLPFLDTYRNFFAALLGTVLLFVVSLLQRRAPVRDRLARRVPYLLRILLFAALFFAILYFGVPASGGLGGFMYAEF